MITLYGIPNCGSVKKAQVFLDAKGIPHTLHNYKKQGIAPATLEAWALLAGWEKLLNRQGTTWRKLSDAEKASVVDMHSAIALMCNHPSLIKRPIIPLSNTSILIGFDEATYQQAFQL